VVPFKISPEDEVSKGVLVLIEYSPHFSHVGDSVVVFST
jgi:hypothetical protein